MTSHYLNNLCLIIWRAISNLAIKVFYRHYEVAGFENIPHDRGIIFCANHVNALVDPVLVQAASHKLMRPLARSGLFEKVWLKPILNVMGAIPIYRSSDQNSDTTENIDSFNKVYELLEKSEWIIIFPEGQSHSQSSIQSLKTGAARMALGTIAHKEIEPLLIPVGLTFTKKGSFRGDVLVYFGHPIDLSTPENTDPQVHARVVTRRLTEGLREVTINTPNWEDLELVSKIERFFAMRHGKYQQRNLVQRFKTLKRLIARHQLIRAQKPELLELITHDLNQFSRLCKQFGVKDYHLNIAYRPYLVFRYSLKLLIIILLALPFYLWGVINSIIPFYLTRHLSKVLAKSSDQHDTAKILLGLVLFSLFWGIQSYLVFSIGGTQSALIYFSSLIIGAVVVLNMQKDIFSIKENITVFLLFIRNKGLKEHLLSKRTHLEKELAKLVKTANRLIDKKSRI